MHLILLQIGRPILHSVQKAFGKDPDVVLSHGEVGVDDYHKIIKAFYQHLRSDQENHIVLSGPVSLNFALWQVVWLNHFHIKLYQRNHTKTSYDPLPLIDRNVFL